VNQQNWKEQHRHLGTVDASSANAFLVPRLECKGIHRLCYEATATREGLGTHDHDDDGDKLNE
jgi:hypothetical protein